MIINKKIIEHYSLKLTSRNKDNYEHNFIQFDIDTQNNFLKRIII
jgi:hypothetical protein